MKTKISKSIFSRRGFLEVDMMVALAVLALAIVPVGFSINHERAVLRTEYCRGVADEIVDGEMEILAAGAWTNYPDGAQRYSVSAKGAGNLPAGRFELTKNGNHLRLEWLPEEKAGVSAVVRETTVK